MSIRLLFVGLLKTFSFSSSVDSGAGNACSLLTSFRLTVHVMNDWIINVLILHTFACVCSCTSVLGNSEYVNSTVGTAS